MTSLLQKPTAVQNTSLRRCNDDGPLCPRLQPGNAARGGGGKLQARPLIADVMRGFFGRVMIVLGSYPKVSAQTMCYQVCQGESAMNRLSACKSIPVGRLKRVCQGVLLLVAMSATTLGHSQTSPPASVGEAMGQLGNALGSLFGSPAPGAAPVAPNQLSSAPQVGAMGANQAMGGPISANYQALFQKGTVTGQDLYETLKAMRLELHARRSALAWAQLSMALNQGLNMQAISSGLDIGSLLTAATMSFAMEAMKNVTASVAMKTLDDYLQYLLDERGAALAEESITLPSMQGMSDVQAKRAITMATLIVTARLSDKVLEKANQDFKSLEVDYKSLLSQRESAANLLFATIDQRRMAQRANNAEQKDVAESELKKSLNEKDLAFIDTALNTITLADFAKNMAAQNL
ncbi:MAG: hypothetical protein V4772_16325, partial [Pseudomonadota bacterium]